MASWNMGLASCQKQTMSFEVSCSRKRDRDRERGSILPYKVVEITPPPKSLGVRCLPPANNDPILNILLLRNETFVWYGGKRAVFRFCYREYLSIFGFSRSSF
eukprot:XP_014623993.1 uncharacterized protein LOC100812628 isoform X3 [Glycine max]